MRRSWPVLLPVAFVCAAQAQSPVHFADRGVKSAVEAELWVTDPAAWRWQQDNVMSPCIDAGDPTLPVGSPGPRSVKKRTAAGCP